MSINDVETIEVKKSDLSDFDNIKRQPGQVMESFETKINQAAALHVKKVLADLYTNPVTSVVREYVSNAVDAHRKAGDFEFNTPIEINVSTVDKTFEVIDHGCGMSLAEIKENFGHYGASSKGDDGDQIGNFGIGSKAALSITDDFRVTTVKDEIQTDFIVYIDRIDIESSQLNPGAVSGTAVKLNLSSDYATRIASAVQGMFSLTPQNIFAGLPAGALDINVTAVDRDTQLPQVINKSFVSVSDYKVYSMPIDEIPNSTVELTYNPNRDSDIEEGATSHDNITFNIGGVFYKSPIKGISTYSSSGYGAYSTTIANFISALSSLASKDFSIIVSLPPGAVDFNSSREAIKNSDKLAVTLKAVENAIVNNFNIYTLLHNLYNSGKVNSFTDHASVLSLLQSFSNKSFKVNNPVVSAGVNDFSLFDMKDVKATFDEFLNVFPEDAIHSPVIANTTFGAYRRKCRAKAGGYPLQYVFLTELDYPASTPLTVARSNRIARRDVVNFEGRTYGLVFCTEAEYAKLNERSFVQKINAFLDIKTKDHEISRPEMVVFLKETELTDFGKNNLNNSDIIAFAMTMDEFSTKAKEAREKIRINTVTASPTPYDPDVYFSYAHLLADGSGEKTVFTFSDSKKMSEVEWAFKNGKFEVTPTYAQDNLVVDAKTKFLHEQGTSRSFNYVAGLKEHMIKEGLTTVALVSLSARYSMNKFLTQFNVSTTPAEEFFGAVKECVKEVNANTIETLNASFTTDELAAYNYFFRDLTVKAYPGTDLLYKKLHEYCKETGNFKELVEAKLPDHKITNESILVEFEVLKHITSYLAKLNTSVSANGLSVKHHNGFVCSTETERDPEAFELFITECAKAQEAVPSDRFNKIEELNYSSENAVFKSSITKVIRTKMSSNYYSDISSSLIADHYVVKELLSRVNTN